MTMGIIESDTNWFDWVAFERAIAGKPVGQPLTRAEKLAVARHVIARGGRSTAIAKLLHVNDSKARDLYLDAGGADLDDEDGELDGAA